MIDANSLLRVSRAITVAALVVVAIAVFVRVMYGPDPVWHTPTPYGLGMMGTADQSVGSVVGKGAGPMMVSDAPTAIPESAPSWRMMGEPMMDEVSGVMMDSEDEGTDIARKVVRTGSLTLRVDDADWSVGEIGRVTASLGGSVDASDVSDDGRGMKSGMVTVRVPVDKFDEAMEQLKGAGRVVINQSKSGADVTEQVIDTEARIRNKQAEEQAYAEILKNQATKVSDVIEVTRALNQVRAEIESLQGQLTYLSRQADMSTISVYLSEDPEIGQTEVWRPWQVVKDAVNTLIVKLQALADFFIRLVIIVLPTLVIFGLGLWIVFVAGRWAYRKVGK